MSSQYTSSTEIADLIVKSQQLLKSVLSEVTPQAGQIPPSLGGKRLVGNLTTGLNSVTNGIVVTSQVDPAMAQALELNA